MIGFVVVVISLTIFGIGTARGFDFEEGKWKDSRREDGTKKRDDVEGGEHRKGESV